MKKLVLILVALFAFSFGHAQEVKQTGKTFEVTKKENKSEPTGYTIVVDGITYPIYKGKRGGYFYYDKDKKRKYVPAEIKEKLKNLGV